MMDTDPATGAVLIPLGSRKYPGHVALVDPEDAERVRAYRWTYWRDQRGYEYAQRVVKKNGKQRQILMHRFILDITDRHVLVDHEDHNGLNNRRSNIRVADHKRNQYNRGSNPGTSSRFKGVSWDRSAGKWAVRYQVNKVRHYLGTFDDEIEAARAYDTAVAALHGAFARPNLPDAVPLVVLERRKEAA